MLLYNLRFSRYTSPRMSFEKRACPISWRTVCALLDGVDLVFSVSTLVLALYSPATLTSSMFLYAYSIAKPLRSKLRCDTEARIRTRSSAVSTPVTTPSWIWLYSASARILFPLTRDTKRVWSSLIALILATRSGESLLTFTARSIRLVRLEVKGSSAVKILRLTSSAVSAETLPVRASSTTTASTLSRTSCGTFDLITLAFSGFLAIARAVSRICPAASSALAFRSEIGFALSLATVSSSGRLPFTLGLSPLSSAFSLLNSIGVRVLPMRRRASLREASNCSKTRSRSLGRPTAFSSAFLAASRTACVRISVLA